MSCSLDVAELGMQLLSIKSTIAHMHVIASTKEQKWLYLAVVAQNENKIVRKFAQDHPGFVFINASTEVDVSLATIAQNDG